MRQLLLLFRPDNGTPPFVNVGAWRRGGKSARRLDLSSLSPIKVPELEYPSVERLTFEVAGRRGRRPFVRIACAGTFVAKAVYSDGSEMTSTDSDRCI